MKVYCQTCGAKVEFSVKEKPKFCHGCGSSLNLGSNRSVSSAKKDAEIDQDEGEQPRQIPSITGLDVELTTYETPLEKIGEIMGSDPGGERSQFSQHNNNDGKLSKEEFHEQFKREAGSLRPSGVSKRTDEQD